MGNIELIVGTVVITVFSLLLIFIVFCQYMDYKSDEADRKAEYVKSLYVSVNEASGYNVLIRITTNCVIPEGSGDAYKYAYEHFGIYFVGNASKLEDSSYMYDFCYYDKREKMVCKIHTTFNDFINKYENLIKKYS